MTENIEWGACPVCGGRVTGKVDGWRSDGRLHVEQPYDEPPVCENGCPLEGFAPYIALVVECGDGESAKEAMEKAVGREWSRMLGTVTRVNPCVCGGTPVLELREGCQQPANRFAFVCLRLPFLGTHRENRNERTGICTRP